MDADKTGAIQKKRGPKPKGDKPMSGADRARQHRERLKALIGETSEIVPLVIHTERLRTVQRLANEIGKPYQMVLATLVEKVLLERLALYEQLPTAGRRQLARLKPSATIDFELHWQFCALGSLEPFDGNSEAAK